MLLNHNFRRQECAIFSLVEKVFAATEDTCFFAPTAPRISSKNLSVQTIKTST
jgi:hypothetical protein